MQPLESIGVVIPTRNAMRLLPAHVEEMRSWLHHVSEVVVVDSDPTDGSGAFLRRRLHHPGARFFTHPPGLYDSWNFGIERIRSRYTYISTVGDSISLEGMRHLAETATALETDLLISPPEFVSPAGHKEELDWPIADFLHWTRLQSPRLITAMELFAFTAMNVPAGLLGSSASNLYRTDFLKKHPFPTDFGHVSDTAWTLRNAFCAKAAVSHRKCSRFLLHPSPGKLSDREHSVLEAKFVDLAKQILQDRISRASDPIDESELLELLGRQLVEKCGERNAKEVYDDFRTQKIPWILRADAWKARARRNYHRRQARMIRRLAFGKFFAENAGDREGRPGDGISNAVRVNPQNRWETSVS